MKKTLNTLFFVILLIAPFLVIYLLQSYYASYEELARKYECYPFENCSTDYNGDGVKDLVEIVGDSGDSGDRGESGDPAATRLKFFLDLDSGKKEILDLKFDRAEGAYRTHIAQLQENGVAKIVVYDTTGEGQYFHWDGKRLAPTDNPTYLERDVRTAMALSSETGAGRQRLMIESMMLPAIGAYYFIFVAAILGLMYFGKKGAKK